MSVLLENPVPIIVFGVLAEAILGVLLLRTGRGMLLWAMAGVLALVLLGVLVERLVVTEKERVEAVLEGAAAAVEANDLGQLDQYLAASATETRGRAAWVFGMVRFISIKITDMDIQKINYLSSPPTVKATVHVVFTAQDRQATMPPQTHPYRLDIELRREPDGWKITGHSEPQRLGL